MKDIAYQRSTMRVCLLLAIHLSGLCSTQAFVAPFVLASAGGNQLSLQRQQVRFMSFEPTLKAYCCCWRTGELRAMMRTRGVIRRADVVQVYLEAAYAVILARERAHLTSCAWARKPCFAQLHIFCDMLTLIMFSTR